MDKYEYIISFVSNDQSEIFQMIFLKFNVQKNLEKLKVIINQLNESGVLIFQTSPQNYSNLIVNLKQIGFRYFECLFVIYKLKINLPYDSLDRQASIILFASRQLMLFNKNISNVACVDNDIDFIMDNKFFENLFRCVFLNDKKILLLNNHAGLEKILIDKKISYDKLL